MADLSAWIQALQPQADAIYNPQKQATQSDYDQQVASLVKDYNSQLGQANQQLNAIPGKYQPQRESAYLAYRKSMDALPAQMANAGYASNSGLAYDTGVANNTAWQKSVDTANQAQNTATQTQQNNITNLNNSYNSSKSDLSSKEAAALADLNAQESNWVQTNAQNQYNAEQQREEQAAEAAAQLAEQQREYNQQQAAKNTASVPTLKDVTAAVKGQGPDAALAYLAQKGLGNYASQIGYSGIRYDQNGNVHVLSTLDDYANAAANGWMQNGYMYDQNGGKHLINTLNEYNQALAKGWTTG